ncbi:TVA1 protein, partial [Polyodon spathula]|nr:TVA1 protein [Polyodon spathula]
LSFLLEMTGADSVTQTSHPIVLKQSESTIIQCKYETASTPQALFWYIQDPNQAPLVILNAYSQAEDIPLRFQNRFSAFHNKTKKTFHLNITVAVLPDSATYFCALSPTL